jgi:hypothetical protein
VKTGGGAARRGRSAAEAAAVSAVKAAREVRSFFIFDPQQKPDRRQARPFLRPEM